MRLDIRYRSVFAHTEDVSESHNELRACPLTDQFPRLLEYRVTVNPSASVYSYVASLGNRVATIGLRADPATSWSLLQPSRPAHTYRIHCRQRRC